jgi:hypothetical protein
MWDSLNEVLTALPPTMKAVSALIGSASVGALAMLGVGGWLGIPAKVETQTLDIARNRASITIMQADLANGSAERRRILCLIELQLRDIVVAPLEVNRLCPITRSRTAGDD